MNRRQALAFGGVAAVAASVGSGVAVWRQPDAAATDLPAGFWSARFARPEGGELALADFRGGPLLINFWATWCAPCVRELPAIDRFAELQAQAKAGVRVIGLAVDGLPQVREFLLRVKLQIPIGIAGLEGSELSRQLGNAQGSLPFTVLADAAGRLQQRRLGETNEVELSRWASALKSP